MYKDSSKPDYLALDWETKHDQLWSEIKSDSSLGEYYPTQMFTESLITTFENEWDVLPKGRNKAIHGNGAICPFTVDVSNGKIYSGPFILRPRFLLFVEIWFKKSGSRNLVHEKWFEKSG